MRFAPKSRLFLIMGLAATALTGCSSAANGPQLPPASFVSTEQGPGEEYIIGPLDELTIFVWRNPERGGRVQVGPTGGTTTQRITDRRPGGKRTSYRVWDITANH